MWTASERKWKTLNEKEQICGPSACAPNIKVKKVQVKEILLDDDRAKVVLQLTGRVRFLFIPLKTISSDHHEYWIYEDGSWFLLPFQREDEQWKEDEAVRVFPQGAGG